MGKMIGIDLGTTNSVVAIVDGPQPRVLENREARAQTRSVVGLKKRRGKAGEPPSSEVLVGDAAFDNWAMAPRDTIISVKRLMGRGVGDAEVQKVREWALYEVGEPADGTREGVCVTMGAAQYSPVEVSALILGKLKSDAEYRLGEPVTHAVITVPAYFSQIQRDATRKAGLKSGLKVIKILEEPTAAAIAFGMESGDGTPKTLLVYDLGGGTFDISILMWAGNVFAPLNLEGDMWLGGDNLDQTLVDHVSRHVKSEYGVDPKGNIRFMAELKKAAQSVKERLSAARTADLMVTGILQDGDANLIDVEMEVTREEFERLILPLVGRYRACTCGQANYAKDEACARCRESLRSAPVQDGRALHLVRKALAHPNVNMTPDQVDCVLMAGNSTSIPLVQESMEEMFGAAKVLRKVHPKHSVALGAAMVAAWRGAHCVCPAPDPQDARRECGHVNRDEATACARCGAPLGLDEPAPLQSGEQPTVRMDIGSVGGIAPFNYGTQTAGDQFHVFIHKGDPFPTQDKQAQVFRTRVARQRMVSIPVYGGDDLGRASANEKQGEAFAVLPPDLPAGAPIRVKMWLDGDGIFALAAHLDDGSDLQPWVVKGEADAKAIDAIQAVDKVLAEKGDQLSRDVLQDMEAGRHLAFDRMRAHDFEGARREADRVAQAARQASPRAPASLRAQAENLAGWTEFVLQQYGWGFEPDAGHRLNQMAADTRAALRGGDPRRLEERLAALDAATTQLPDLVDALLGLRHAITSRVRAADAGRGAGLLRRLEELEDRLRTSRARAGELPEFIEEVSAAVRETSGAKGARCSLGHLVPAGERHCPQCAEDTWGLDGAPQVTGGPRRA